MKYFALKFRIEFIKTYFIDSKPAGCLTKYVITHEIQWHLRYIILDNYTNRWTWNFTIFMNIKITATTK